MDNAQLKYLPDDMKDRYSKLEQTFNSPGWALIAELAQQSADDARQRQLNATTWDLALVNRGAAMAFAGMATLRETIEMEFAALASANAERDEAAEEVDYE